MIPFGKIDPKKMQSMMQKMGINSREIDAEEVIIKCSDKSIVIENPQVAEIDVQGNKSFQISGIIKEVENIEEKFSENDIGLVMEKAKVSKEKARKSLENSNGDIAKAILSLKK